MTEEQVKENEELHKELKAEYTFDLDNMPEQTHRWKDRGLVMSCEGAGHPNHRHFKSKG